MNKLGQILVVDDEEVLRDVLDTLLRQAGYGVSLAASSEEALQLARKGGFDAAIVDVMLPDVSGLELLDELKRIPASAFEAVDTAALMISPDSMRVRPQTP